LKKYFGFFLMSELYNTKILRFASEIPHLERLDSPDVTITKTSRICGSRVTVDINFNEGKILNFGQEVKACALGQASCAIVGHHAIGQTLKSFKSIRAKMEKMLKETGPAPDGNWADLEIFLPARGHKSRHTSIMLPFDAILEAFKNKL
jgi:NifU-like protein involved in Fe-S cluster formation